MGNAKTLVTIGLVTIGLLIAAPSASAHAGDQSYAYLDIGAGSLSGRVEMPFPDIEVVFDVSLDGNREETVAEVERVLPDLIAYVDQHFDVGTEAGGWPTAFGEYEFLFEDFGSRTNYLILPFEFDLPVTEVPQVVEVRFDPFVEEIEGREALLLIGNDYGRGVFDNEANHLEVFDAGRPSDTVDFGDASAWKNFSASVGLGIDHIRTGPDHVFFVLVLLLPSVLVYSLHRWRPVARFGSSLWRVLKLVTMFTVAHSITFTLASLDILPLPSSKFVETVIALSIAAAALNNIWPFAPNREWAIAGAFGLFHGMGFATLVDGLDVDRSTELVSLLGRNVGIEIGQAAIVLMTFPPLFLLRRTIYYRPIFLISSTVMVVVSIGWMFERLFEENLGYNEVILRLVKFPRSLFAMIVVTALAALVHLYEARRNRLLPLHDAESEIDVTESDDWEPARV